MSNFFTSLKGFYELGDPDAFLLFILSLRIFSKLYQFLLSILKGLLLLVVQGMKEEHETCFSHEDNLSLKIL